MSYYDRGMAELHCTGCGERQLMRTRQIFNPEKYAQRVEAFTREHKLCARFKDQAKARAALRWKRIMEKLDTPAPFIRHSLVEQILANRKPKSWIRA